MPIASTCLASERELVGVPASKAVVVGQQFHVSFRFLTVRLLSVLAVHKGPVYETVARLEVFKTMSIIAIMAHYLIC